MRQAATEAAIIELQQARADATAEAERQAGLARQLAEREAAAAAAEAAGSEASGRLDARGRDLEARHAELDVLQADLWRKARRLGRHDCCITYCAQ